MTKQEAAQKIVKLLALYNGTDIISEKNNAFERISQICSTYHLRIEGINIIDVDIEKENEKKKFEDLNKSKPNLSSVIEPEKSNLYVYYKGKKYYAKQKKDGTFDTAVPKSEYKKNYLR